MHHLQHIAELAPVLERLGASRVIIAPGSRNAPLIQLFTGDKRFTCHSMVDERSAAYAALGMARQSDAPVVVVTTSGTAVLNLGPAVAEAFHQQVPLVLLTADRPLERVPQFNNQVTDQRAPFFNHSKGFFEFPIQSRSPEELQADLEAVEALFHEAVRLPRGPVHVNLPLDEPLYVPLPEPICSPVKPRDPGSDSRTAGEDLLGEADLSGKRVLVLAGMGRGSVSLQRGLEDLLQRGQVAVVAENLSNLVTDQFISVPELLLAGAGPEELDGLEPEAVVAFGLQLVSKRMKLFVNALKKAEIHVIPAEAPEEEVLAALARALGDQVQEANRFQHSWQTIERREVVRASAYMETAPFSNLAAVHRILGRVPAGTVVHLGNSATVRYSQLLRARPDLIYYSNRGVSGIDGSMSAAAGAAMVSEGLHLLLVGDLSFAYDSNAMWNRHYPDNLKVVVMNDGGGGIFRLLEGPDQMEFFEEYSVTHHPVSVELLSQSFGRSHHRVSGWADLDTQLDILFAEGSGLSVLEVDTTSAENSRIFKGLFR
jgi:2-succinyl-5-enolpyruvyl-6-hydroxy-3-cyclohexene-1-carboxylate synthase